MVAFGYIVLAILALCAIHMFYQNIEDFFEEWDAQFEDGDGE